MPKNQQSFHKRWGLLFFLLITLTLVSQLPLPDLANASEEQISFSLEDVGLIETGTLVTFRGHPIGKVHSIEFIEKLEAENSDASLPLFVAHANISRNAKHRITAGSKVQLRQLEKRGNTIDITPGHTESILETDILVVDLGKKYHDEQQSSIALSALRRAAESVGRLGDFVNRSGGLYEMTSTLVTAGESLNSASQELRQLVREGRIPILQSIQNAEELLQELRTHAQILPDTAESISIVGRKTDRILDDLHEILQENRAPIRHTVENLNDTSHDLHGLVTEIRSRPWRILNSPGDREGAFIALHECANRYAEGAVEVRRTTEIVRDLLEFRGKGQKASSDLEEALRGLVNGLSRQAQLEQQLLERTRDLAAE